MNIMVLKKYFFIKLQKLVVHAVWGRITDANCIATGTDPEILRKGWPRGCLCMLKKGEGRDRSAGL